MSRHWLFTLLLAMAICAGGCGRASDATPTAAAAKPDVELAPDSETIPGEVPPGATLGSLLVRHDLKPPEVEGMLAAIEGIFDARRVRAGQPYLLERALDGTARRFDYEIDAFSFLRLTPWGEEPHTFAAEVVPYDVTRSRASVAAALEGDTTSLFAAMDKAGELPDLSIALAEIFAGEVDFNSELQPGDRFQLSVDKASRDGRVVAYGPILAARMHNDGRDLTAIRFQPAGGQPGYYDAHGRSLKRFFLRSPLKFDPSISSGFSRSRLHPVLNIRRAHLGVDYRAPTGAPVVAVSHGTVTMAAWTRGGGRTVKVRHASGYETAYLHLSSFGPGIRAGVRVAQGQLIGRVGSTGLATGPHLHYELRKNGAHVNPAIEHRKLPPGDPVPASQMAEFEKVRDEALRSLVNHKDAEAQGRTE
jgi:murein DD-endopeptidase MepM/ murein hydrolase activator NlpD